MLRRWKQPFRERKNVVRVGVRSALGEVNDVLRLDSRVPSEVDVPRRVRVRVEVPVETGRFVDVSEEGVLCSESSCSGVVEAGLGEVEIGLLVPEVTGEGEAVSGAGELVWEAEVTPGILGP